MKTIGLMIVMLAGCSTSMGDMMSNTMNAACGTDDDPDDADTGANSGSCTPVPGQVRTDVSCRHRGGNFKHNWFADYYGNEFYPTNEPWNAGGQDNWGYGCDADMGGISYDGVITAGGIKKVFEVKTANYTNALNVCGGIIAEREWSDLVASVAKEEPLAAKCGYEYDLVICDAMLALKAMNYDQPPHTVNVVLDTNCTTAPSPPDSYSLSELPPEDASYDQDGSVDAR